MINSLSPFRAYLFLLWVSIHLFSDGLVVAAEGNTSLPAVLAESQKKLESWKKDTNDYYSKRLDDIEKRKSHLTQALSELERNGYKGSTYSIILQWRASIDKLQDNILGTPPENPFETSNKLIPDLVEQFQKDLDLQAQFASFYEDYLRFAKEIDRNQESYAEAYLKVLGLLNKCRALILKQSSESDYQVYFSFHQVIQDVQREIVILPKIYITSWENKLSEIRNNLKIGGAKGYYAVLSELLVWIIFCIFIVVAVRRFDAFQLKIELFLDALINRVESSNVIASGFVFLLEVFSRSATWILIVVGTLILKWLLRHSLFFELELPLNILELFAYYKIVFFALRYLIVRLRTANILSLSYSKQLKLLKDLSSFVKLVYYFVLVLSVVDFVASRSLLFQVSSWVFGAVVAAYVIYILDQWKVDLYKNLSYEASHVVLRILRILLRARFVSMLISPLLLAFWFFFSYVYYELQRFDVIRKLSAKFLVLKARRISSKDNKNILEFPIPDAYVNQVLMRDNIPADMVVDRSDFFETEDYINAWLNEKSLENTIAIEGYCGSGKTTLIQQLVECFEEKAEIVRIDLEKEYLNNPKLNNLDFVFQGFVPDKKYILFIDNFEKCFLPQPERKEFLDEIKSKCAFLEKNILLCVAVQRSSWKYINNIQQIEDYFLRLVSLSPFSFDEVKSLILKRHKRTRYKISFAEIALKDEKISPIKNHEERNLEQLMKVIWQQSEKNPYHALYLWCSCISLDKDNVLIAHYPRTLSVGAYKNMEVSARFILAVLLRYHSLSIEEICFVLGASYSRELINVQIKALESNNIIVRNVGGFYFLDAGYYWDVLKYLEVRGYVT